MDQRNHEPALIISRILHAGYVLDYNGTRIVFDPIFENPFSRNCLAFPDVCFDYLQIQKLKIDAVFISHHHDDHCSLESLKHISRQTPIYLYCLFEELFSWIRELGFTKVYPLKLNRPIKIGDFEVIPQKALDEDVDSIFHIKAGDLNILNVVDSWIDDDTLAQLAPTTWDMILWPFQTMREIEVLSPRRALPARQELPAEWKQQLLALNPKYIVPSSCQFIHEDWSWYNQTFFPISYQLFAKEIGTVLPKTQVVRLNPSRSVSLHKNTITPSSPLSWLHIVGEEDVDYVYDSQTQAPPTAEISQKFSALTDDQTKKVYDYCSHGLIHKFKSLRTSDELYFKKPRLWQLSIYDHRGLAREFRYIIHDQSITLISNSNEPLSWVTEVPLSRMYGALELGETLTSMYMRINDKILNPDIEKELNEVDIIEDPLIRCLFTGVFGRYQKTQLERIKQKQTQ